MTTLGDLRAALLPGAPSIGADVALGHDPTVGWVRVVRARVPALDGLEAGDVVVAPVSSLTAIAAGPSGLDALVVACSAGRAAAILVAGRTDTPADEHAVVEVADAARLRELPVFRLDHADPPALERSVAAFLVNRRAELEHQAALLEARLERLALDAGDLDRLVAEIASSLGRAVVLEGPRGEPLAVHAPAGVPDAAPAVRAYHDRPSGAALRAALPGSAPAGRVVLLGERPPSELERLAVDRIAGLLALQLARDDAFRRARDAARRADTLPAAGPPWVLLVARQVPAGGALPIEDRESIRREIRLLAPARRLTLRGDAESLELRLVLATAADDPAGIGLATRIAASLSRPVAVSRPFTEPGGRPVAEAEARATLEAIEALPEDRGASVARADRRAAYRLLGAMHNLPDGARLGRELLAPLLSGRPTSTRSRERLRTLRAVLETAGPTEAAAALGVHRNTVAYRQRRIEALTGWQLADPELRLALAIAVQLVQQEQLSEL